MESKRLKILVLTPFSPYPPDDGGKICIFGFIDYLRCHHDFTLLTPVYTNSQLEEIELLKSEWPNVDINIVNLNTTLKQPTEIEKVRNDQVMSFFKRLKRVLKKIVDINKVEQNPIVNIENVDMLQRYDFVSPFGPIEKEYIISLTELLKINKYDIIQVELTRYLNLIKLLPQESKLVFEQLESRHEILKDYLSIRNENKNFSKYVFETCEDIENFLINKYNAIFALNSDDKDYLQNKNPDTKVYVSPFSVLDRHISKSLINLKPSKIVFSGNGFHYPNYDALKWYLDEMHQAVFNKTQLKLFVTGNWPDDMISLLKIRYAETTEYAGFVDDYNSFLENSIMVAPIRLGGGGLRAKVLYAMANGIPVVTTPAGIHGIKHNKEIDVLIADNTDDFIKSIEKYFSDDLFYRTVSKNSKKLVHENYSQTVTSEIRNSFYKELVAES